MNNIPATRYRTADRLAFISGPHFPSSPRGARRSLYLLLVHRQHALGDKEAAEDIHAGEDQRDETEAPRPARRPRSPRRSHSSPTSAAYAAPASPTTQRNSRRRRRERKSTA